MRKYSLTLMVVVLVLAIGLGAVACGSGDKTASGQTPQELLTASFEATQSATAGSGDYEVSITLDADTGQMSGQEQAMLGAFLGQPLKITGTFAAQEDPRRADLTVALGLMGMNINAGIRVIDTQAWVNVLGQWYEAPDDMMQQASGADTDTVQALQQAIEEQGIDPNTWLKDLKVVGDETLVDTQVTHLTGTVDVQKMISDVLALMQNPKVAELLAAGSAEAGAETGIELPSTADLEEAQATLEQMIETANMDMWIAKGDGSMRKMMLTTAITVPEEMATSGLNGAGLVVTVNLDAPGTSLDIQAPASAKPITDLEQDLQSNPLLSGLGSLLGSGAGIEDLLAQ